MADGVVERARLVSELGRVQELVWQLDQQLQAPSSAASAELCRRLAHQIVALTDRSIGMVRACPDLLHHSPPPSSGAGSPLSSDAASDHAPFSRPAATATATASPKKRKATARWTSQQVRVSAGAGGGAEGPADDGHSWRKYGQKDILGAKHPRAYYRCTHRNSQSCPATKQVQRTDDDPALFDVVYHGEHTCMPAAANAKRTQPQHNPHAHAALQGLAARLTVATADAAIGANATALPPMTPESCPVRGASSPWPLASPVGSDSNGWCNQGVSPCPLPAGYSDWASDGDLQEVVSAFAAVSSGAHLPPPPPALDNEFVHLDCFGFDHSFNDMDTAMPGLFYP